MGLLSKLFGGSDEPQCGHEEHPSEDSSYWYKVFLSEHGEPYWCEHTATYTKLQAYSVLWTCKTCGELSGWHSAREVGGPEGIIRKQDVEEGIIDRPEVAARSPHRDVDWYEDKEALYTEDTIDEYITTLLEYAGERDDGK